MNGLKYTGIRNLAYITGGFYTFAVFMKYIKQKYTSWFERYNYTLDAALQAGATLSVFIISFAVQFNSQGYKLTYNKEIAEKMDDINRPKALKPLPEKGYIGPALEDYLL